MGQLYVSILIKVLAFFELSSMIECKLLTAFSSLGLDRGIYSVLGAAAMTSSVTRTVSVAMIVLELNGHLSHACPTMVCVLCSYAISEYIRPVSFFEMLSEFGGLDAKIAAKGKIIIKDILYENEEYRPRDFLSLKESTQQDLVDLVKKHIDKNYKDRLRYLPVVDSISSMNLMYQIKVQDLREYCELYFGFFDEADQPGIGMTIGHPSATDWNNVSKLPQPKDLRQKLLEKNISNDVANSVFQIASQIPSNPAREILTSMRHIPPHVIYQEAPISYMAEGQANKFFEGEGENTNDQCEDPSVIIYYIVQVVEFDEEERFEAFKSSCPSPILHHGHMHQHKYGCKLVGMIPCSDSFGVDLILERYNGYIAKRKKEEEERKANFMNTAPETFNLNDTSFEMRGGNIDFKLKTLPFSEIQLKVVDDSDFPENIGEIEDFKEMTIAKNSGDGLNSSLSPLRVTLGGDELLERERRLVQKE